MLEDVSLLAASAAEQLGLHRRTTSTPFMGEVAASPFNTLTEAFVMQHVFAGVEGPVEVTTKTAMVFARGCSLELATRGRLLCAYRTRYSLAHVAKVGDAWWVHVRGHTFRWERIEPGSSSADTMVAWCPHAGKVLEVLVKPDQTVKAGEPLMVLEAMKMEHRIVASADGTVRAIHFEPGDQVMQGAALLDIEEIN